MDGLAIKRTLLRRARAGAMRSSQQRQTSGDISVQHSFKRHICATGWFDRSQTFHVPPVSNPVHASTYQGGRGPEARTEGRGISLTPVQDEVSLAI